jgi:hypothetical protein
LIETEAISVLEAKMEPHPRQEPVEGTSAHFHAEKGGILARYQRTELGHMQGRMDDVNLLGMNRVPEEECHGAPEGDGIRYPWMNCMNSATVDDCWTTREAVGLL